MAGERVFPILYVDDEPQNLVTFKYALEGRFEVLTADSGQQALALLAEHDVAVLVCDQRMPGMSGVEVCSRARDLKPEVARIILTAYTDMQVAIDAINKGHVFRYLTKPWNNEDLVSTLDAAVDLVRMRRTVADLQARVLRGTAPPFIETVLHQLAAELRAPVARLEMSAEQIGDLLTASVQSLDTPERAQELLEHARSVQTDSLRPVATLKEVVQRLAHGQRLIPEAPPATCDVSRVARAAVRIVGVSLPAAVKVQLELSAAPVARIDAADLGQALVHLLAHAAQAAEQRPSPTVRVEVRENHAYAEVHVSDSGMALLPEQAGRVFDPYYVARVPTGGVGLALVQRLVVQAGGSVTVESPPEGGVRFVVRIPSVPGAALG